MGWETLPRCETCKKQKQEANRWLVARFKREGVNLAIQVTDMLPDLPSEEQRKELLTFCGSPCFAQRVVQETDKVLAEVDRTE